MIVGIGNWWVEVDLALKCRVSLATLVYISASRYGSYLISIIVYSMLISKTTLGTAYYWLLWALELLDGHFTGELETQGAAIKSWSSSSLLACISDGTGSCKKAEKAVTGE